MSRRAPPGVDKSEQNRATLKQLVKLEANKSCADCKRNKHPRWASWNLGIFICIRCSGIHRGMGTHISRVKSVDLDSWTDEQMASMIKWGNARANKYWEAKLADGHIPNEAKIENFIRTKYDSKRWVMDGPIPDPSTLGDGTDDDVPLNVVQENLKARMGGPTPQQHARNGSIGGGIAGPPRAAPTAVVRQPQMDLFGDGPPARPNTTEPAGAAETAQQRAPAAPPKQFRPGESLLGLDFFGGSQSTPPVRPSSTGPSTFGNPGRTDLKQSILSLYASKPAPPPSQSSPGALSGMQSSPMVSPSASSTLGGLGDAFGSLSFTTSQQPKAAPFSNFGLPAGHGKQSSISKPATSSYLSGGTFFDSKPNPPPKTAIPPRTPQPPQQSSFDADFGEFSSAASPSLQAASTKIAAASSMGDLFDISAPGASTEPVIVSASASNHTNSAFNLSQQSRSTPSTQSQSSKVSDVSALSNMDAWGTNDAWSAPDSVVAETATIQPPSVAASAAQVVPKQTLNSSAGMFEAGWGNESNNPTALAPTNTTTSAGGFSVQQDEEFGGWSHASPIATTPGMKQTNRATSGGGGGQDDLFGNVWG